MENLNKDQIIAEARKYAQAEEPHYAFPLFGVECGKGWELLYLPLIQLCQLLGVAVRQVKEKFGGLRFYVGSCPEKHYYMLDACINAMEHLSYDICEVCGKQHTHYYEGEDGKYYKACVTTEGGWLRTLCTDCWRKQQEARAAELDTYRASQDTATRLQMEVPPLPAVAPRANREDL